MQYNINPNAYKNIFAVPTALVDDNIRLASVVHLKVIIYLLRHINDADLSVESIAQALGFDKHDVTDALGFWQERGMVISSEHEVEFSTSNEKSVKNFNANLSKSEMMLGVKPMVEPEKTVVLVENVGEVSPYTAAAGLEAKANAEAVPQKKNSAQIDRPEKKIAPQIVYSRPSHQDVVTRLAESAELKNLFQEAQNILGKTIGFDGQTIILQIHDTYGMPTEVIMTIMQYCVDMGKSSFSNIAKIARIWADEEILTLEQAEEYIEENGKLEEVWLKFIALAGLKNRKPTTKQKQLLTSWVKEFGFDADMIYYAYEECIDHADDGKMSFPYMNGVMINWNKKGIKTPMDIKREQEKWQIKQATKYIKKQPVGYNQGKSKSTTKVETSYDIDEYMQEITDLTYVKKNFND